MENLELLEAVTPLLEEKAYNRIRTLLAEQNPIDVAALLEELDPEQVPMVYRLLPKGFAAEVFAYMESDTQERLLNFFSDRELSAVLKELYLDDMADLLEEMPASVVKRLLRLVPPEDRQNLNRILQYPEKSAGSVLTTEFVDLKANMTVAQAFQYIRSFGPDKETIYTCYVTDTNRCLQGVLSVKDLLLAKETDRVGDIMETNVIAAVTTDDQETVAQQFAKYDLIAMPVVDSEHRLVGIVTVDDVVDILQEETTEDLEIMAAITPTDKSYFKTGVWETFRKRIPWLLLLMLSSTFTGVVMTTFEKTLMASVVLTAFIPMLMGTGGNSGSQSSVTIIRALAVEDVHFRDAFRVLSKELRVAFLCGVVLAVVNFLKMLVVDRLLMGVAVSAGEAAVIAATLLATVVIAKAVGGLLPLVAKRLGLDPAVMASPFITTVVDVLSLLVYFGFANWILY